MLVFMLAIGCGGKEEGDDSGGGGDGTTDTYEYRNDNPVIFEGDALCAASVWTITATVGDKQGKETVVSGGFHIITGNGTTIVEDTLECADGVCTGDYPLDCSMADELQVSMRVTDEDGNDSVPIDVLGHT